jgi:hypothetical protein
MIELEVTKSRVETQVDFGRPGRKLERLHHGGLSRCGGVLRLRTLDLGDGVCRRARYGYTNKSAIRMKLTARMMFLAVAYGKRVETCTVVTC